MQAKAAVSKEWMAEQDHKISDVVGRERTRLKNFIRRRVPDESDAEDILQEVFYELVAAARFTQPVEQVGAWLFRVAKNRIIDLFRKRKTRPLSESELLAQISHESEGRQLTWEELLPSPDAGPEAVYARSVLLNELEAALEELPEEQRDVFVAHELEGQSFKEISAGTAVSVNTLLSRKHYAVIHLRQRLKDIYDEFVKAGG